MITIITNRSSVSIDRLRGDDEVQSAVTKPGSDGGKHGADDEGHQTSTDVKFFSCRSPRSDSDRAETAPVTCFYFTRYFKFLLRTDVTEKRQLTSSRDPYSARC